MMLADASVYNDGRINGVLKGKTVIWVADLNNEGSSVRDKWFPAAQKAGGKLERVFFYVDRREDGVEVMKELGLGSHAVVPLDEPAWAYLRKQGVVTEDIYQNLIARGKTKEERREWAVRMLRSERGLQRLYELLSSLKPKEPEQGKKVLNIGYPDLKDELVERLKKQYGDEILLKV